MNVISSRSPEEEWLTPHEVARLFRVDHKTVKRWIAAGRLKASVVTSHTVRIARSEVNRLLSFDRVEYHQPALFDDEISA